MSHFAVALVLGTLLDPLLAAPVADPSPTCRAFLKGNIFTTRLEYRDGFRIEAAWTVLGYVHPPDSSDPAEIAADLTLDRLFESDPVTSRSRTITPAEPLHVLAVAENPVAALERASDTWCTTVHRARLAGVRLEGLAALRPGRLT